jgi:rare lipoprotein A
VRTERAAWLIGVWVLLSCVGAQPVPSHMAAQGAHEIEGESDTNDAVDPAPGARTFAGRASYYSDTLAGNHTANGEIYDPTKFTAASRTLPFGTRLRVTRIDNGRKVEVRVNDRGPFGRRKRILDLSRAAAEELDMIRAGVVKVRVEVLGRD